LRAEEFYSLADDLQILITCEHGGNRVPPPYRHLFPRRGGVLDSHRGWDPGALVLARELAGTLGAELFFSTTTRLLIDLNRSPGPPALFSPYTRGLAADERRAIMDGFYTPYRAKVEETVRRHCCSGGRVVHLSVHSFSPRLDGDVRRADLGLLYDPRRSGERRFCRQVKDCLKKTLPALLVRRNYPYRGTADGLTTWLRRQFGGPEYLGVELELNQRITRADPRRWRSLRAALGRCLRSAAREPMSE
jgi:predicted N-formylglutamate amidohydrolase